MGLPDNFFWEEPVNLIPTRVASITLATLSTYSGAELLRIGWYLRDNIGRIYVNPAIDRLYELTIAGVWIARTNSSGQLTESNSASIVSQQAAFAGQTALPSVCALQTSSTIGANMHRRIGVKDITLANGVAANQVLVAALAGYYGVIELIGLYSSAALDGGDLTAAFQDEDDAALIGAPASMTLACIETAITKTIEGITLYSGVDNKALEVDIDSGGAAADNAKHVYLLYYYWYET